MKFSQYFTITIVVIILSSSICWAQNEGLDIENSAEVFLEEYSDSFQESFFEALKQKGIENYDKAINLLLECKLLDTHNTVIDHELAKVYYEDKQYLKAQEFAIEALLSEPENLWFLHTLVLISQKQGGSIVNLKSQIPYDNIKLKENLALIYYRQSNFQSALNLLNDLEVNSFTGDLSSKINSSIKKKQLAKKRNENQVNKVINTNPLEELKGQLENLINTDDIVSLLRLSNESVENYPSQPYFYYTNGYALNKSRKHKEAIEILETALDYMLDDMILENKIYKELVDAYTALNNPSKANMYLRMIKPGF